VPSSQREKLLYFVLLRQMEAPSASVRDAYQRLADAASNAGLHGVHLMKAAVALSNALGQ
jgi:hypothetical protein